MVLVASFPLFIRERFTGDVQLKTQSRNGVRSLKCLHWTEDGATVPGKYYIIMKHFCSKCSKV